MGLFSDSEQQKRAKEKMKRRVADQVAKATNEELILSMLVIFCEFNEFDSDDVVFKEAKKRVAAEDWDWMDA